MNHTPQQVVELSKALDKEARRVARWAITCLIFALATSALVIATRSLFFLAVALFAWFFAWNRWKLQRLLISRLPSADENQEVWFEKTVKAILSPPLWYRVSEHIATVTVLVLYGILTIVIIPTSGIWKRLLFAAGWLTIAIRLVMAGIDYAR